MRARANRSVTIQKNNAGNRTSNVDQVLSKQSPSHVVRDLNHDVIKDFLSVSPPVCCSPFMLKLRLRPHAAFETSLWSFGINSEENRACRPYVEPQERDKGRSASSSSLIFETYVTFQKRSRHAMYNILDRIEVCDLDFTLQQVAA